MVVSDISILGFNSTLRGLIGLFVVYIMTWRTRSLWVSIEFNRQSYWVILVEFLLLLLCCLKATLRVLGQTTTDRIHWAFCGSVLLALISKLAFRSDRL